jgi:hypothetical protein
VIAVRQTGHAASSKLTKEKTMLYEKKRNYWFIVLMIATLLANAMMVTPVLADDSVPPQGETTENVTPPGETTSGMNPGEEAHSPTESEAEETSPEAPTVPQGQVGETPSEPLSVAEVVVEIPEDTNVVVLNEEGENLPLATQEAAELVHNGDPIWCPAGVAVPMPNQNGCSPSFGRFNGADGLLAWLQANDPGKAGTVWIESTYNSSTANSGASDGNSVVFNGGMLANMSQFALTLKGGWEGAGTGTINGTSTFNGTSLNIIGWKGSVTLSDILITNVAAGSTCGSALCVETDGVIKLERINSSGNDGTLNGADLANTGSVTSNSVTVVDSSFSENVGVGLIIDTDGAVTLKKVTALGNATGDGVRIDNTYDGVASSVSITDSNFNHNGNNLADSGLYVLSNGSITLTGVLAVDNSGVGVALDNVPGTGNITLAGTNVFNNNGGFGLYMLSKGSITARHLIANNNDTEGVFIDNTFSTVPKAVTISGSGQFNNNGGGGLFIASNGAVTLTNLIATSNGGGVFIDNDGPLVDVAAAVKINGVNNFSENTFDGLFVYSDGAITLSNVTANANGINGVFLDNSTPDKGPQSVTLVGYLNAFGNTQVGLHVKTQGAIKATNLNASHNGKEGAILDNSFAVIPKDVTVSGQNTFAYNVNGGGLVIYSRGTVTLNNITAIGNGRVPDGVGGYIGGEYIGLYVNNAYDPAVQKDVIIKGNNVFNANGMHGVQIQSYGAIQLANVTANRNGFYNSADYLGNGLYLLNNGGQLVKPVTLSGVNLFDNNNENGLSVVSEGAITVSKVTAIYNGMSGLFLNNLNGKAPSRINILGYGVFDSNLAEGLLALSNGAITTNNLTANNNGNAGVDLRNFGLTVPQAVTLNGINSFIHNGFIACSRLVCSKSGLNVISDGNITVNNITANDNNSGVFLVNADTVFTKFGSVLIKGYANISGNFDTGLFVKSKGNATLNQVSANSNGGAFGDGIALRVDGNVILACSNASNNVGLDLVVSDSSSTLPVKSLTLSNSFLYSITNINSLSTTYKPCP